MGVPCIDENHSTAFWVLWVFKNNLVHVPSWKAKTVLSGVPLSVILAKRHLINVLAPSSGRTHCPCQPLLPHMCRQLPSAESESCWRATPPTPYLQGLHTLEAISEGCGRGTLLRPKLSLCRAAGESAESPPEIWMGLFCGLSRMSAWALHDVQRPQRFGGGDVRVGWGMDPRKK